MTGLHSVRHRPHQGWTSDHSLAERLLEPPVTRHPSPGETRSRIEIQRPPDGVGVVMLQGGPRSGPLVQWNVITQITHGCEPQRAFTSLADAMTLQRMRCPFPCSRRHFFRSHLENFSDTFNPRSTHPRPILIP